MISFINARDLFQIILFTLVVCQDCPAETIVTGQGEGLGNTSTRFPFLVSSESAQSTRYQQIYRSSSLSTYGPVAITEISFARVPFTAPIDVYLPNVEIALSTTQKPFLGLSSTFSANVGADRVVVYSGPLHFATAGQGTFNLPIALDAPFDYNPQSGNLLLDVKNFSTIPPPTSGDYALDAAVYSPAGASVVIAFDTQAATGITGGFALLTQFTVTPIPEPTLQPLIFSGIMIWAGWVRVAKKCSKNPLQTS